MNSPFKIPRLTRKPITAVAAPQPATPVATPKVYHAVNKRGAYISTPPRLVSQAYMSFMTADGELLQDMLAVRTIARHLSKQNNYASRFLDLVSTNVVGSEGITLQPRFTLKNGKPNKKVNDAIDCAWDDWGSACTVDGRMSWLEVQDYCARATARDGEVFVVLVSGPAAGNKYGLALQILDSDMLDHRLNRDGSATTNAIKLGVEVDAYNRPVAYHFYDASKMGPYSPLSAPYIRVEASKVLHLYRHNASAMQTRGVSWLHPVLMTLKEFQDYTDAALEAAHLVAAKVMFFQTDGTPGVWGNTDAGINPGNSSQTGWGGPSNDPYNPAREIIEVSPGTPTILPPGMKVQELNTDHPGITFAPFTIIKRQEIASGLNVSYASLTGDLSQANNASAREGQQREHDHWKKIQTWFQDQLCQKVYEAWLKRALLGPLNLPSKTPSDFYKVGWQPRGYAGNDPYKDAKALKDLLSVGAMSRTQFITERGGDPEKVMEELAYEARRAKELGLNIDGDNNLPEIQAGIENQLSNATDTGTSDDTENGSDNEEV